MITSNQQAQKDRARAEAEHHLNHSAVDRMRESRMMEGERKDAMINGEDHKAAMKVRDANDAYAGEE